MRLLEGKGPVNIPENLLLEYLVCSVFKKGLSQITPH